MKNPMDNLATVIFNHVSVWGLMTNKTTQYIRQLHPCDVQINSTIKKYWVSKIKVIILILVCGIGFSTYLWIVSRNNHVIVDGSYILRNEPGMGKKQVYLIATDSHGKSININVEVNERRYTQEELDNLYEELLNNISSVVLNYNESWDKVVGDLSLVTKVQGYPFNLEWECSNYHYLSKQGQLIISELDGIKGSIQLKLCLQADYGEFYKEHIFEVSIQPELIKQNFRDRIARGIDNAQREDTDKKISLPDSIDGEEVSWTENQETSWAGIIILTILIAVGIWIVKDHQVYSNIQKRNQLLIEEYPTIISKITLYMGAGMNLYSVWKKLSMEGKDNPIYEEMLYTSHEIEAGTSQIEAYEKFVLRVKLQQYTRLITLLSQNLQKGNAEMLMLLRHEAVIAIEDSKAQQKRKGEEMSTKLLFPMVMMLGMVMLLVVFPVFMSM